MADKFTRVIKLKLHEKSHKLDLLWEIQQETRRAANITVSSQYQNDAIGEAFRARRGVDYEKRAALKNKILEQKKRLQDLASGKLSQARISSAKELKLFCLSTGTEKSKVLACLWELQLEDLREEEDALGKELLAAENDFEAMFGSKRQASSERDIKEKVCLPSCVSNRLTNDIVSTYNKEKQDVLSGKRSLRTYRRNIPIPVHKKYVRFIDEHTVELVTYHPKYGTFLFQVAYGRDCGGYKTIVNNMIAGKQEWGAPSFEVDGKDVFLAIPLHDAVKNVPLDPNTVMGIDLGLAIPAYVAIAGSPVRKGFLDEETFLKQRTKISALKRRAQRNAAFHRGGHGRGRKLQYLDQIEDKERNFVKLTHHRISKAIVDLAVLNQVGTLRMEFLEGIEEDESKKMLLRFWSPRSLQKMIEMKAARYRIAVEYVDPWRTSQTCSSCGNWQPGQRISRDTFVCAKCGLGEKVKMHADYNAALNIAKGRVVDDISQCQYVIEKRKREAAERAEAQRLREEKEKAVPPTVAVA